MTAVFTFFLVLYYPSVIRHNFGVHVPDEHVQRPLPFLREDGRVEGRLLSIDHFNYNQENKYIRWTPEIVVI